MSTITIPDDRVRDFVSGDGRGFVVRKADAKGIRPGDTVRARGQRFTVERVTDKKDGFLDLVLEGFQEEA